MDMNEYAFEIVTRDRLAEMRAAAERSRRVQAGGPASHPLRVALGHALIRIGRRLRGVGNYSVARIDAGGAATTRRTSTSGAVGG
jgi:hypothetical protein